MRTSEIMRSLATDIDLLMPGQTLAPDIFDAMRTLNASVARHVRRELAKGAEITFEHEPEGA